ncbi:MAG: SlyX family protein [Verrucomicrobiales bacterium]|nr:SlyX family protein [Verrucomicrobiales bacterium]
MDATPEERLTRIEAHLAHLERQNEALNEVVIEQSRTLTRLTAQLRRITESVENAERERIAATNPKPPHYQ